MATMAMSRTLPVALLALAAAACGEPRAETETEAPAAAVSATAAPDIVRTADPAARGYGSDEFPRVQEVAAGVHTYEQLRAFGEDRVATVSMFVVTDEGVLVADGQGSPEETQTLIDRIAQVTNQPITTVVVGSDHSMASAYPSEWVEVIRSAQGLGADTYVPGHGFVDPPAVLAEELDTFRGAIQTIIDEVEHVHAEGAAVEEALAHAQFGDADTWSRAETLREPAIRRAHADLNGELIAR
jgi:hypothetical protein